MAAAPRGPTAAVGYHLWRATTRWRRALAGRLADHELTPPQFFLLGSLFWLERNRAGAPTQRTLAERAGLDPMTTSQNVRALESRGVIERAADPDDARAYRLHLTRAGKKVAAAATAAARALDREFFAPLGGDRDHFIEQLDALAIDHEEE